MQASGAKFDMVMSTKEQETFETALSARDGFKAIKEELSQVDVRQVREHTALAALQGPGCGCPELCTGAVHLSSIGRRSAATSRTRMPSCSSWRRAWAPSSATVSS